MDIKIQEVIDYAVNKENELLVLEAHKNALIKANTEQAVRISELERKIQDLDHQPIK